jgi:transaldolase
MTLSPLASLMQTGTKIWLDSVDPNLVKSSFEQGITGATSNPIIIADLIRSGRFDSQLYELARLLATDAPRHALNGESISQEEAQGIHSIHRGGFHEVLAWAMTNSLVSRAEATFLPLFHKTHGDDGYVSFEVDPLLEDSACPLSLSEKISRYIEQGKFWSKNHPNRMIKVPATEAGLGALEELAFAGIPLNVTLIFSKRQYRMARDNVWKGVKRRGGSLKHFKSVYSIFVSRLDVYSEKFLPSLSAHAQGQLGILNAKEIWRENADFWRDHPTPLKQEIVFASTGTKKPTDTPWKYVAAFAGSDIETNPPATNDAVEKSGKTFSRDIDILPAKTIVEEIHRELDPYHMEKTLMDEGLAKFAEPQKALIATIASKLENTR